MLLSRLSINLKLLLLCAVPLLLLIIFLSREGNNLYEIQKNSYQTKVLVEFGLQLDNIAHNHAIERGLTAGFLGSAGTYGKDKLFKQREKSDRAVDDLKTFIETHQSDLKYINAEANADSLIDLLKQKPIVRNKVDQLTNDYTAFNYYTSVNKTAIDTIDLLTTFIEDKTLDTIDMLSTFDEDNTLRGELLSLVEMIWLKERAGQSRGALNDVFSKGSSSVHVYTSIFTFTKDFTNTLEKLINNRRFHAKPTLIELSRKSFFNEIDLIQNNFLKQSDRLNSIQGPTPEQWFPLATQRIDAINSIVSEQASYTLNEAVQIHAQSKLYLMLGGIMMLALISALIFLSYYIARNISSRINNIDMLLTRSINDNDLSVKMDIHGNDEVTHIAKGINSYISWLKDVVGNIKAISLEHEYLASHDGLTKIANRNLFISRLTQLTDQLHRHDRHHALMYIDLDFFKKINDQYGHAIGDHVLKIFADRLVAQIRKSDTAARLGGDEFAVILEEITSDQAQLVAKKILKEMQKPLVIDDTEINITISIGITFFSKDESQDPTALLNKADHALYDAKKSGRKQYRCFDKALKKQFEENARLESDLETAIANEEISPHFQPQYCLNTQRIVGLEALARWHHPQKGFVPPDKFIPLAEKLSLISLLTTSIMRQSCTSLLSFMDIKPNLKIAINISGSECSNLHICHLTQLLIEENKIRPEQIELEITESVLVDHPESSIEILTALHDSGVSIAIDDFGTGYSSLSYLTSLPIDILKIDMSFVQGIGVDPQQEIVIKIIIDLAKQLSLKVIAEGIETQEQEDFLVENGCDYGQGYFYSKPCSAQDIKKLLELDQLKS
jgi:diguanylate cyclase (GGDEF)-like protein